MKRSNESWVCGGYLEAANGPAGAGFNRVVAAAVRAVLRRGRSTTAVAPAVAIAMALSAVAHSQTAPADRTNNSTDTERQKAVLSEVVVTARRKAIESADELKKVSESIIDSVNADDAGKLPDASITEVLQRVPGVTIDRWGDPDHFQSQGTGIQVRGLSGVAGRINGREVFSATGGNGLSWSDIPPELMAGVDVYKAATADLIEGGTGGQVDLRTKRPFDFPGFAAQVSGNADYADFRKKTSPTGSALISDTWDTRVGRIGVLVDLAYGKYASHSDFMAVEPYYKTLVGNINRYIPGGFDYGTNSYDRTRKGAYAAVQWQPTDNLQLAQTYWESKYEQANVGQGVFMTSTTISANPNGSVFDASGGLLKSTSLYQYSPTNLGVPSGTFSAGGDTGIGAYSSDTRDLSTTFKLTSDSGRGSLRGSFQAVDASHHEFSYDVFPTIPFSTTNFGMDTTGVAVVTMPAATQTALRDPTQYTYGATQSHLADNVAKLRAENIDFEYTISDSGFFRSFQTGARYADHTEADQTSGYNWTALGKGWNGYPAVTFAQGSPGDYSAGVFGNFFQGRTILPGNVLLPSITMATRADPIGDHAKYGNPLTVGIQYVPGDRADVQYTDAALYSLIRFADDKGILGIPYNGNFGARLVRVKHESRGFYVQNGGSFEDPVTLTVYNLATTTPVALSGGRSDTRLLPSLNFRFVPNERWQTRFAFNETLDLPKVTDIQANGSLGISTTNVASSGAPSENVLTSWNVTFGNPDLRPVIAYNFDLSEEWYPKTGTALHFDLFHKTIENALIYTSISRPWPVVYTSSTGATVSTTTPVNYSGVYNSPLQARINGAEVGAHTYFDMLPGVLKGFGIDTNYTFIDSKNPGNVYYDISGQPHHDVPLVGLSRHNFNTALLYDYKIWSARLAYSWRSEYLLSTDAHGTNGTYNYYTANTPSGVSCLNPATTTCQYIKIALPVYAGAYGQLDFGLTLRPSDHYYVSFQVANLGNTIVKSFQGGYPGGRYPRNWFISDRHFNLTAGLKF